MPNKDVRGQAEVKTPVGSNQQAANTKAAVVTAKAALSKSGVKETAMSPAPAPVSVEDERTELLGSLTTQQQQRTSARVIKKLRLEPPADKRDVPECETPNKIDDKDTLKFPTVKQRMPKALWSADEKSLFFEALNEYGKDFDAITAYICAKMKKKGMPDANLKTKTQVSHFYYRTWHKLSKHVHFDENVKKVAQELYALINYGELRRKLAAVNEKTCARLGDMVRGGSIAVRARGRTLRVRTPMCRALRRLNHIAERACGLRVCSRAQVYLRARDAAGWARVQAAAHNPRAAAALPLRTRLAALLHALQHRWTPSDSKKSIVTENGLDSKPEDHKEEECPEPRVDGKDDEDDDHLHLETDRIIVQEQRLPKKLALHVGPRAGADIQLPVISPSEQLSSQKICFSSYLERMGSLRRDKDVKIRTPKRQRKDSVSEKDKEVDPKKIKMDESESNKLMIIDETAIDGIELMANYKNNQEEEEKPSTEDEKEMKSEEAAEEEVDRELPEKDVMSEKEKDSFSELEDDEKYNKSDTDNESDGKGDKNEKRKFKNLKVKFRIRPKKRGGSIYTLVLDKDVEDPKLEEPKVDEAKSDDVRPEDIRLEEIKTEENKEEESKPDFDLDMAIKQIRKGWSVYDAGELTIGDLYLMFGARSKIELDYWWAEPTPPLPQPTKHKEADKADKDKLVQKEKTVKTPDKGGGDSSVEDDREKRESDTDIFSPKNTFSQDSNDGMSGDERKCEQLASPEHKSTSGTLKLVSKLINRPQAPSSNNNGLAVLSDRLKRLVALAGNLRGAGGGAGRAGRGGGAHIARCDCGHVCPLHRQARQKQQVVPNSMEMTQSIVDNLAMFRHPTPIAAKPVNDKQQVEPNPLPASQQRKVDHPAMFRHPTPIAPKLDADNWRPFNAEGLPRTRRGRGRQAAERRVVVQRLLPLLPKLPPPNNLIPVKIVPKSPPAPPRILPKPPPTTTSDLSYYYVLSESNGQFFFHDGDRRIPISSLQDSSDQNNDEDSNNSADEIDTKDLNLTNLNLKTEVSTSTPSTLAEHPGEAKTVSSNGTLKAEQADMTSFLPSESLSLSPSRLLRDADGWLDGSVHDFSLSSFLAHLDARPQPDLAVDSQLHSLMAESSVDYVAKFADLAAEVTDDRKPLQDELEPLNK